MQSSEPIRIIGITAIRNEEDIVEAFVRHSLKYCTELIALNHGSTDSTPEILQALQHEGLPLTLLHDNTLGDVHAIHMNRLMHMAVRDFAADWIICLDSDEFIQGPLVEHIHKNHKRGGDDEGQCFRIRLVNYRAHRNDRTNTLNTVERITHHEEGELRPKLTQASKVFFSRAVAMKEGAEILKGNHRIVISGITAPFEWVDEVSLAHFPLRSPSQYGNKIASQVLLQYFRRDHKSHPHHLLEKPFRKMRESYSAFVEGFYESRANWVSAEGDGVCLIDNAAEYKGGELRYTCDQADTDVLIRHLLDLGENMATQHASQATAENDDDAAPTITLSLCPENSGEQIGFQTYPASTTTFSPLRLSLENLEIKDRIRIGVSAGKGLVEISELTVRYQNGQTRKFQSEDLYSLLTIDHNGLTIHHPAQLRFAVGIHPFILTFAGEKAALNDHPVELTIKARVVVDPKRISSEVLDTTVIRQINTAPTNNHQSRARYLLGENISFGDSDEGRHFLRGGWGSPQHWGVWSKGDCSKVYLRLERPTSRNLTLKIQVRLRRKGTPVKLSIKIDQEKVFTTILDDDSSQWLTIPIPANPWRRYDLSLSFHIESPNAENGNAPNELMGIGIKRLHLEDKSRTRRLKKAVRNLYEATMERLSEAPPKGRIELGQETDFHRTGYGPPILRQGWGVPTETGCLMERPRANLEMQLPRPPKEALTLKIWVQAIQESSCDNAVLVLEIDGRQLAVWEVPPATNQWLEAVIPSSATQSDLLALQFRRKAGNFELKKMRLQKR